MSRPQLTHDLLSDPDEERSRSSGSDSEGEGGGNAQSAQDRKREALYLPISSICAALGGQEEFKDKDGNIYKEYSLGDQVIGKRLLFGLWGRFGWPVGVEVRRVGRLTEGWVGVQDV